MALPKKAQENDQVAEAYESISKRLAEIRGTVTKDDEEESDNDNNEDSFDKEDAELEVKAPISSKSKDEDTDNEEIDPLDEEDPLEDEADSQDLEEEELDKPLKPLPGTEDPPKTPSRFEGSEEETVEPHPAKEIQDEESNFRPVDQSSFRAGIRTERPLPEGIEHQDPVPDTLDDLAEKPPLSSRIADEEYEDMHIPSIRHNPDHFPQRNFDPPPPPPPRTGNDNFFRNSEPPRRKGGKFHLLILGVIGLAVIAGTVYLLKYKFNQVSQLGPSPSPEAIIVPSPVPSPSPELDRSKFKIRVLNGTGKTGLAASVSGKLKDLGYQTDKTANAANTSRTTIKVKAGDDSLLQSLTRDLSPDYDATSAANLKDSDTVDGEVTIGLK